MSDRHTPILCLAAFMVGGTLSLTIYEAVRPKCPSADPYIEAIAERDSAIDSLRHANAYLIDQLAIPDAHPDTITIRVRERLRLQRAVGLDSIASIVFADPQ